MKVNGTQVRTEQDIFEMILTQVRTGSVVTTVSTMGQTIVKKGR